MTDELEAKKVAEASASRALEARRVFISHTHADRELALALKTLIDTVFSGIVTGYTSSDPGPTGGIMPGREWYSQIEARLREAEAVWVLATPASVTRPWIYWEAGIGKILCPNGVVVVRVGVGTTNVPSPLNSFQSYDGMISDGITELAGKVATQVGMKLPQILTDDCAQTWLESAGRYEPLDENPNQEPELTPERLDRLDAAIARLESMQGSLATRGTSSGVSQPSDSQDERLRIVGESTVVYPTLEGLIRAIEGAPPDTTFESDRLDREGDPVIFATNDGDTTAFFLRGSALERIAEVNSQSPRVMLLLAQLAALSG